MKKAKVLISIYIWLCVNFYRYDYILSRKNDNSFKQTLRKEETSSNCYKIKTKYLKNIHKCMYAC